MKRLMMGLSALGALAAAGAYAQDGAFGGGPFGDGWQGRRRPSAEDRAAFADAHIAALHAGLKLTADQEKLWPPVEDAMRGLMKQRHEAMESGRERFASMRQDGAVQDVPGMLRFVAERQAASAEALRKLADAAQPLYSSLDESQKRRLSILSRGPMARGMGPSWRGGPDRDGPMRRG